MREKGVLYLQWVIVIHDMTQVPLLIRAVGINCLTRNPVVERVLCNSIVVIAMQV